MSGSQAYALPRGDQGNYRGSLDYDEQYLADDQMMSGSSGYHINHQA